MTTLVTDNMALLASADRGIAKLRSLVLDLASVGKIRSIPIELPPQDDQPRIVAKVQELLAICDLLKGRIAAARAKHTQLAEALVAEAVAA